MQNHSTRKRLQGLARLMDVLGDKREIIRNEV